MALAALGLGAVATDDSSAREPALDQYVPSLPSAAGNQAPRLGSPALPAALPPAVRARLLRQPDGVLLLRIATAPGLGAPPAARTRRHDGASGRDAPAAADGSAFAAVRSAVREPALLALLGGILASACALLGIALAQRRRA